MTPKSKEQLPASSPASRASVGISSQSKELYLIIFLALTVSILISIKVFIYDGCYAFDSNDDVNHTFVNLKAAQDIMRQGEIPEINLFNNFGTPIIGDALTFPYSLQSITYWFLPNYLAMTINRALIAFLTIIFIFLFLRTFLSPLSSIISTVIVFFAPGVFWNFAHHHYQMTLLYFAFILFIQSKYLALSKLKFLLLLFFGYTVALLSISIQPILLSLPFVILFLPVKEGVKGFKAWTINIIALTSATILTFPQTYLFFQNIAASTRAHWSPYSGIFSSERQQILSLILPAGEWMPFHINGHFNIATYFSIAFLTFTLIGIISLLSHFKKNLSTLAVILILGILPMLVGYLLQYYGQALPFVRSVDSTRLWWFSNIFVVISIGKLVDSAWDKDFNIYFKYTIGILTLILFLVTAFISRLIPEFSNMAMIHKIVFWGTSLSLLFILFSSKHVIVTTGKSLIITVLLLSQIPTFIQVLGLNLKSCERGNHYFSYKREANFQPTLLLGEMEKNTRLTTEEYPVGGRDLKGIFGGILGSNARAIVASQNLMNIFNKNNLIKVDDTYFFNSPWQTEKLNRLGIRYILLRTASRELQNKNWKLASTKKYLGQKYYLYENPNKATPLYIDSKKPLFLTNYQLLPNGIWGELPKITKASNLVSTFYPWDAWRAYVDGKEVEISKNDLGMMQIPLLQGNKTISFKYQRLNRVVMIFALLFSIAILSISFFIPFRTKNE